ncbi:NUDIX hydrolase [Candidatus Microgenomates bacterium]|nr:NUDIX hydrolase [Candidatus Microgenomates bacterium]
MAQKSSKLIREFSSGGIVLNKNGQVLITSASSLRDRSKLHWKFPKGHVDLGESTKDAAIREVQEETGVKAKIIDKVGDSRYVFQMQGERIFKIVTYFLMQYEGGRMIPQEGEIEEVRWVKPEEALKMLSFSPDRKLLKIALEM